MQVSNYLVSRSTSRVRNILHVLFNKRTWRREVRAHIAKVFFLLHLHKPDRWMETSESCSSVGPDQLQSNLNVNNIFSGIHNFHPCFVFAVCLTLTVAMEIQTYYSFIRHLPSPFLCHFNFLVLLYAHNADIESWMHSGYFSGHLE